MARRRYERLAQARTGSSDQLDIALNSVQMMAPGSNAALTAGAMQIARTAERIESIRADRLQMQREREAALAEVAMIDASLARVEAIRRELGGSRASQAQRQQPRNLPPETYRRD